MSHMRDAKTDGKKLSARFLSLGAIMDIISVSNRQVEKAIPAVRAPPPAQVRRLDGKEGSNAVVAFQPFGLSVDGPTVAVAPSVEPVPVVDLQSDEASDDDS